MRIATLCSLALLAGLFFLPGGRAQKTETISDPNHFDGPEASARVGAPARVGVPRLIRLSGVLKDISGRPITGLVEVTFILFKDQEGGDPLWWETQLLEADQQGRYAALLGAMHGGGLPLSLFTTGEARWLEIRVGDEFQRPRVLLVSVPYALEAGDAETLAGNPASAFVLSRTSGVNHEAGASDPSRERTSPTDNAIGVPPSKTCRVVPLSRPQPCTYSSTWAVNCNALGTNQSINLTPSGSGLITFGPGAQVDSTGGFRSNSGLFQGTSSVSLRSLGGPVLVQADGANPNITLSGNFQATGQGRVGTQQNYYLQSSAGADFGAADSTSGLVVYPGSLFHGVYAEIQYAKPYSHDLFGSVGEVVVPAAQTNPASSNWIFGTFGDVDYYSTAPANALVGADGEVYNENGGTVSTMVGVDSFVANYGPGTVTSAYGFRVEGIREASGTITNAYGLYVPDLSSSADNAFAIYADGGTKTFFGGSVGIGTSSPTQTLEVNGGVRMNSKTAKPACDPNVRGTFWVTQGGESVKDSVEVCAKDAADVYAWRTIF